MNASIVLSFVVALAYTPGDTSSIGADLDKRAVYDTSFAKPVLYTWTTSQQIDELRKGSQLLSRDHATNGALAPFDQELLDRVEHDELAALLRRPGLSKRRFAWTSPWGTALGLTGKDYGDQLIRITLKPEAVVARFEPGAKQAWRFEHLDGKPATVTEVLDHPDRLGAVLHVRIDPSGITYREYVLCNESMIDDWQWGTTDIRSELDAESDLIDGLIQSMGATTTSAFKTPSEMSAAWSGPRAGLTLEQRYATTLSFAVDRYTPTPEHLRAIQQKLKKGFVPGQLLHQKPQVPFDFSAPAPPPPKTQPTKYPWGVPGEAPPGVW
jgi:hypothetical protein